MSDGIPEDLASMPPLVVLCSCGLVDDALHLAAVEVEFASDGALAVTGAVPGQYSLLPRLVQRAVRVVQRHPQSARAGSHVGTVKRDAGLAFSPDQRHQEFEGTGQAPGRARR